MLLESMLTTEDNPFDPFTQFDEWNLWDTSHGYHTQSLLARVIVDSIELSDASRLEAYNEAVDEIVRENVSGIHKKVTREITEAP